MRINATSTTTKVGAATVLNFKGSRSATSAEVLAHLAAIAGIVPANQGVIICGRLKPEALMSLAATIDCLWLARHQPKLRPQQAVVVWPPDLVGDMVEFSLEPEEYCPKDSGHAIKKNGTSRGKQSWLCKDCGHQWNSEVKAS